MNVIHARNSLIILNLFSYSCMDLFYSFIDFSLSSDSHIDFSTQSIPPTPYMRHFQIFDETDSFFKKRLKRSWQQNR